LRQHAVARLPAEPASAVDRRRLQRLEGRQPGLYEVPQLIVQANPGLVVRIQKSGVGAGEDQHT
jgi:hypothetical protein